MLVESCAHLGRLSLPVTELKTETYSPSCHLPTSPRFPRPRTGRATPLQYLIRNMRTANPALEARMDGTWVPVKERQGSVTVAMRSPASRVASWWGHCSSPPLVMART